MKRRAHPNHHLVGGSCCNQKKGEDRFVVENNFQAVFDGHRGASVAEFASLNFSTILQNELAERRQSHHGGTRTSNITNTNTIASAAAAVTTTTTNTTDSHHHHVLSSPLRSTTSRQVATFEEATHALRRAFHRCHEEARALKQMSGTTAVVFWSCQLCTPSSESPRTRRVGLCANAGDSRAVLSRGGETIPLSEDHTPANSSEARRHKRWGWRFLGVFNCARLVAHSGLYPRKHTHARTQSTLLCQCW
jgi:serine/threonine protein phosphatase PrpC